VLALTSPAWGDPVANSAASLNKTAKKALGLGKKADKRAKKANKTADTALKTAQQALAQGGKPGTQGSQGPQGSQGSQGPQGSQGSAGSDLTAVCQGNGAQDVMVKAGTTCMDRYEASIWDAPTGGNQITGTIPCNDNGQDCNNIYARSVAGVTPRRSITYFQAQQALANSGKRLPSNAEWQTAVAGTPDSATCNVITIGGDGLENTGANAGCVSRHGVNDMVGNLGEWVADWDEDDDGCANWPAAFGSDLTCFSDATPSRFPGALVRGGYYDDASDAGPFAVNGVLPSLGTSGIGFRGAR
jgi:formylglycine-generating enzyme required for sulfatase activity